MTVTLSLAFGVTFVLVAVLAPALIRYLRRAAYQQHAYEDAPQTHQKKTGTPTLGGLLFLFAPLVAFAVARDVIALAYGFLIAGSAAIGFLDDFLAIRGGRNRGLRARTKFLLTGLVGAAFLSLVGAVTPDPHALFFVGPVPFWVWYLLSLAVILATTHAVNLTDGLDGLASGTIVPPLALLAFVAVRQESAGVATVAVAVIGAVLAFLIYNRHPAKIFMGDTGSLALGAALAGAAILTGSQLLLLLIGGVFVAETLSVIIQVTSFKTTRRRVFRMSPLHHHFELGGWPETRVTSSFWFASLCLGIIGFFIVVRA
ncbi:MAG TPA: phospho-N-acetylmuramoyl-pentapeptide-transferase [Candidatus Lustribacter sp.]|jgi:phospho-N-acetylmuramoyl-pentapeptide-transferase|nr:phospho-N-acetylmuramoyl-pentapeptide-transferase [Candidatus Lustribacter sp.]